MQNFSEVEFRGEPLDKIAPFDSLFVSRVINSIKPKGSSVDFVPTALIKTCHTVFSEIICTLANMSFAEGVFPDIFKSAAVTPLLKKQGLDRSVPENFRPVSNLNNISKILEKLFATVFQPHIFGCPAFNPLQSAYRPGFSTETALLLTLDNIYRTSDRGLPTLLVSLDLSAAFDTIDHLVLLNRLCHSFGVSGTALNWLSSYRNNPTQFVCIGNEMS